jgi:hypothetical protein
MLMLGNRADHIGIEAFARREKNLGIGLETVLYS